MSLSRKLRFVRLPRQKKLVTKDEKIAKILHNSKKRCIFAALNIAMQTLYQTYYSLTKPLPDNGSEAPPPMSSLYTILVAKHLRNNYTQATGLEPLACFFVAPKK